MTVERFIYCQTMRREKKHVNFGSLVKCMREHFGKVQDGRQNGKVSYELADIALSGFACMFFQDPSLLQFQKRMQDKRQRSNLRTLFEVAEIPESTQLRDVLDSLSSESFRPLLKQYFARLQRGKHLEMFQFLKNQYLISLDGTQYFSSKNISCPHCLTRRYASGEVTYSHQAVQAAAMHPELKQVIPIFAEDIRNNDGSNKQDCEINAAKRLVDKLRTDHPHLGIILLGDGLYSHHGMVEEVLKHNMHYIFVAKPNDHQLEHNFGHGSQFLAFNFYLLTILAFFLHQIFELTDLLYREARNRWSKRFIWEQLR
ncbi:MAG: transposase family protein, partial [Candidatus Brocadia sp.]|nr:transposase family protein [Candidatus Brocadia sp.]